MHGPVAASRWKLRKVPSTLAPTATAMATASMWPKVLVSRKAVAPGVMSMATTRMIPTALSEATMVSASSTSRP